MRPRRFTVSGRTNMAYWKTNFRGALGRSSALLTLALATSMMGVACAGDEQAPTPPVIGQHASALQAEAWMPGVSYAAGDLVTFNGVTFEARQGHTSQAGWEPPNVPSLW